jgi:predicted YcjX-like family ATPase
LLNYLEILKADLEVLKLSLKNPDAPHSTDEQIDRMIKLVDRLIKEAKKNV